MKSTLKACCCCTKLTLASRLQRKCRRCGGNVFRELTGEELTAVEVERTRLRGIINQISDSKQEHTP
jgi:hypothetical protein